MLKKIPNTTIDSIISRYQLSEQAQESLTATMSPLEAINKLSANELYNDAVQFIAHGLPVIEAIYWGCDALALRKGAWDEQQNQAINAALTWLRQPNETHRIRASQLADRVGLESAPAWIAKAAYWSGTGSIVAPELPAVMPPPFLYGHAVSAAITVAAAVPKWQEGDMGYQAYYQAVIERGIAIANGQKLDVSLIDVEESA